MLPNQTPVIPSDEALVVGGPTVAVEDAGLVGDNPEADVPQTCSGANGIASLSRFARQPGENPSVSSTS